MSVPNGLTAALAFLCVTYVLEVNVSLARDVVHDVPNLLLPAAANEILLGRSVLHTHRHTHNLKIRFESAVRD